MSSGKIREIVKNRETWYAAVHEVTKSQVQLSGLTTTTKWLHHVGQPKEAANRSSCCFLGACVLSHAWLFGTPRTVAHQAPLSMEFSRQEPWSGLLFPSPMYESEKWKWSHSVMSDSSRPHGLQPTRLLCLWDFPGKSTGVGCHCPLRSICLHHSKPKKDWGLP